MNIRPWILVAALGAAAAAAAAHDIGSDREAAGPQHGGIVAVSRHVHYELVTRSGSAVIYVRDHGRPVSTRGATGKLTMVSGARKVELPLVPAGGNRLVASGAMGVATATQALATVRLAGSKPVRVRFALK
ncbi:MAG TPA: hypothetical protein VHP37_22130 [Burkholderiales bacterium]|nr:hypothetical protein [Burkholderiales bacterium]